MEITTEELPWSSEDESRWNNFLNTETGKRLIPKALEQCPPLLDGADVNKTLVRCGEHRGFSEFARSLLALSHSQLLPAPVANAYPPLEDDKHWQDGEKLTPEEKKD